MSDLAPRRALIDPATGDDRFVELWAGSKRSPHTQAQYRRIARQFCDFVAKPLASVTYADALAWVEFLKGKPDTRRSKVATIKAMFGFAVKTGFLKVNPTAPIAPPRPKETLAERIAPEGQILALLHSATLADRDRLLVSILYYTGCRVSELCGLKWRDLSDGVLAIFGKGEKTRWVRLPSEFACQLESMREVGDRPIYPNCRGEPISRHGILKRIKRIGAIAGIPGLSPHWFRHAHASHSLDRGAPISLVSATLGHSSVAVTSKYTHANPHQSSGEYLAR
jgi:integrase/recombinase XerD